MRWLWVAAKKALFRCERRRGHRTLAAHAGGVSVTEVQWAGVADHATDVMGEDIHPRTVSIGDTTVIDENGAWVGDAAGLRGPEGPAGPAGPEGPALNLYQDTDMDGVEDWLEVVVGTDATDSATPRHWVMTVWLIYFRLRDHRVSAVKRV